MKRKKRSIAQGLFWTALLSSTLPLTARAQGPEQTGTAAGSFLPALVAALLAATVTAFLMSRREKAIQRKCREQLAETGQILSRERQLRQSDHVITVLSCEYKSIFGVDLDNDVVSCFRADGSALLNAGDSQPYRTWITEYANQFVTEACRPAFLHFTDSESIRASLEKEPICVHHYRCLRNGVECYEQVRFVAPEAGGQMTGMAFSDVDSETRDALAQRSALSAALAEAEQSGRADFSILSRMSHQIRTPMNAIIGLDTLALNDDTLSEKSRDYLMKIGDSARHLLSLINEILDMSRIESGQVSLRREEFHFSAMLEQLNNTYSSKCRDKGLSYECHLLSPVDEYYCGDEKKLKESLRHILDNAVRLCDVSGSVTLSVARTTVFDNQTTLLFRIKNTGAGIDKEQLRTLFDAFSDAADSHNSADESSGLGLTISKSLVEMMDGSISVESEPGVGTEFVIMLTLKNCAQRAEEADEQFDLHDMYVLVVDDNLNSAKYTKSVLEKVGIRADLCTSGPDALRLIDLQHGRHQPYHLVLMDCNMPEMNGLEATERIKARYGSEITVVILTAYSWDYIAEDAKRVGVDSFLLKPLFPANVIEEFEQIARRNHITRTREKGKAELAGRRILLAEDMAINAEILMDLLSMEKIEADYAENGKIAVEKFQNSRPGYYSAILMDVRMPEMNGLEATKAIRALSREDAGTIPIIALTANAFDEDVKYSLQAGMNAHLTKPVDAELLFQIMGELLFETEKARV